MLQVTIAPLSNQWWIGIAFAVVAIVGVCGLFQVVKPSSRRNLAIGLGCAVFLEIAVTHFFLATIQQTWSLADSLPLHLCRMSFIGVGLALLTRRQFLYEWSVYLGIPSGLHSFLTPQLTQGDAPWMLFDYWFAHSLLIAVPLMLTFSFGMKPTRYAALKVFGVINLVAAIVGPLNFLIGSNYLYLAAKPLAKNPFLIGPWPWYIFGLEFVVLLHMGVLDVLFRLRPWRVWTASSESGRDAASPALMAAGEDSRLRLSE